MKNEPNPVCHRCIFKRNGECVMGCEKDIHGNKCVWKKGGKIK